MTYLYQCENCKTEIEITKPMSESERVEYCEICESEIKRVFTPSMIKTSDGVKN